MDTEWRRGDAVENKPTFKEAHPGLDGGPFLLLLPRLLRHDIQHVRDALRLGVCRVVRDGRGSDLCLIPRPSSIPLLPVRFLPRERPLCGAVEGRGSAQ